MSRFISAGTEADEPPSSSRDEAWQQAQQAIEATKAQKSAAAQQEDGKSLYETLQANKAAKQEAFEEANRLKNQFQSLDEDEVNFLDSVLETTRAREAEVRRETVEQLEAFRRRREEVEKAAAAAAGDGGGEGEVGDGEGETWVAKGPRKRRKGREGVVGGVKLRRVSTGERQVVAPSPGDGQTAGEDAKSQKPSTPQKDASPPAGEKPAGSSYGKVIAQTNVPDTATKSHTETSKSPPPPQSTNPVTKPPSPMTTGLGLAAYSSDEDDG